MGWLEIYLIVAAIVGSPPAIFTARRHEFARVVGVLVIGVLGAAVLIAGAVALLFNGYVEDAGGTPTQTLHIAIPLLAIGVAVSAAAWWIAARR